VGVAGLGVKRLELTRSAVHEKQDARHPALAQFLGVQRHGVFPTEPGGANRSGRDAAEKRSPAEDAVLIRMKLQKCLDFHGAPRFALECGSPRNGGYLFVRNSVELSNAHSTSSNPSLRLSTFFK